MALELSRCANDSPIKTVVVGLSPHLARISRRNGENNGTKGRLFGNEVPILGEIQSKKYGSIQSQLNQVLESSMTSFQWIVFFFRKAPAQNMGKSDEDPEPPPSA